MPRTVRWLAWRRPWSRRRRGSAHRVARHNRWPVVFRLLGLCLCAHARHSHCNSHQKQFFECFHWSVPSPRHRKEKARQPPSAISGSRLTPLILKAYKEDISVTRRRVPQLSPKTTTRASQSRQYRTLQRASAFARSETRPSIRILPTRFSAVAYIAAVTFPVCVFCWLG